MITKESPIGVIDSGIGGFSVARKVQKLMPHENLLYLGDGANTPYGNHSAEEILTMTRYMLRFMEDHGVKPICWWPAIPSPASSTSTGMK